MSFASILRGLVDDCTGSLAAILMGRDGLPIEQVEADHLGPDQSERIANASVEFGRVLEEVRKAADAFGGGAVQETVFGLDRIWLLLRPVDEETVLVVALAPDGNVGKVRFRMRRAIPLLQAEL